MTLSVADWDGSGLGDPFEAAGLARELDWGAFRAGAHWDALAPERRTWRVRCALWILGDRALRQACLDGASSDSLAMAGFFDPGLDPASPAEAERLESGLTLPEACPMPSSWREAALQARSQGRRAAVLALHGAFDPPHEGHTLALEQARACFSARGIEVMGALLIPSHGSYVVQKRARRSESYGPSDLERLSLCEQAAFEAGPRLRARVDAWPMLSAQAELPPTWTSLRLERELSAAAGCPVEVALCCGEDNAGFAKAWAGAGGLAHVVARSASAQAGDLKRRAGAASLGPVASGRSSTLARIAPAEAARACSGALLLRDTLFSALPGVDPAKAAAWLAELRDSLQRLALSHPSTASVRVALWSSEDSERRLVSWARSQGLQIICMDQWAAFEGCPRLGCMRVFERGGSLMSALSQEPRPGVRFDPSALDPRLGVLLVDDDVSTGSTMAWARSQLPEWAKAGSKEATLAPRAVRMGGQRLPALDCLDADDFLPRGMSSRSGLALMDSRGAISRFPYGWPFAKLSRRSIFHPSQDGWTPPPWP